MVGISAFAAEQWRAAAQGHPALKAIFPFDAGGCYGGLEGFRDQHPGGVIQTMPYHIGLFNSLHTQHRHTAGAAAAGRGSLAAAMQNPDYMMYVNLYNILTLRGQRDPGMFYPLLFPFERPGTIEQHRGDLEEDQDPVRDRGLRRRLHLQDALAGSAALLLRRRRAAQASASSRPPAHAERPLPRVARRDHPLVRPLAQGHRQRRRARPGGQGLDHGREQVARPSTAGRCQRPSGPSTTCTAGRSSAPRAICRPRTPTSTSRRTPSCRCRRPRPTRSSGSAT